MSDARAVWVLDTSVVLKWFRRDETLAAHALSFREAHALGTLRLVAPDLLIYELANALRYKDDLSVEALIAAVESLFDMELKLLPVEPGMMNRAVTIAREKNITVYDAVFVATAEWVAAPLLSADERLVRRFENSSLVQFLGAISTP